MPVISKNIKLIVKYLLGPIVFCILAVSIYDQLQSQAGWQSSLSAIGTSFRGENRYNFLWVFMLMLVNWGIEARKWQLALKHLYQISFLRSLRAVFTGTTMAFFTPNRIGEYFGRILYIPEGKRVQAVSLTIVCSMAQLLITLCCGAIGLFFLHEHLYTQHSTSASVLFWLRLVLWGAIAGSLLLMLFYFKISWLVKGLERLSLPTRYLKYVELLEEFNATVLLRILSLSGIRYIVFLLQYHLLFEAFEVSMTAWDTLLSVSVMFVVLAIAPTVAFLTDLGIRAKAGIELVQFFSTNVAGILATTLGIWMINLVIPSLIGSLLILGIRLGDYRQRAGPVTNDIAGN